MDRRSFLGSILAACAAPAIVRADSLMRIIPRETSIIPATEAELIALLKQRIAAAQAMMVRHLSENLYSCNDGRTASFEWDHARPESVVLSIPWSRK